MLKRIIYLFYELSFFFDQTNHSFIQIKTEFTPYMRSLQTETMLILPLNQQ